MIIFAQYGAPGIISPSPTEDPDNINPYPHEVNITDGSEFLDDAIRTKDQPLGATFNRSELVKKIQNSESNM